MRNVIDFFFKGNENYEDLNGFCCIFYFVKKIRFLLQKWERDRFLFSQLPKKKRSVNYDENENKIRIKNVFVRNLPNAGSSILCFLFRFRLLRNRIPRTLQNHSGAVKPLTKSVPPPQCPPPPWRIPRGPPSIPMTSLVSKITFVTSSLENIKCYRFEGLPGGWGAHLDVFCVTCT